MKYDFITISNWDDDGDGITDYCDELSALNIASQIFVKFEDRPDLESLSENEIKTRFDAIGRGEHQTFPCKNQADCAKRFGLTWERGLKASVRQLKRDEPYMKVGSATMLTRYGLGYIRGEFNGTDNAKVMERLLKKIEAKSNNGPPEMIGLFAKGVNLKAPINFTGHAVLVSSVARQIDGSFLLKIIDPDQPGRSKFGVCRPKESTCMIDGQERQWLIMPLARDYYIREKNKALPLFKRKTH